MSANSYNTTVVDTIERDNAFRLAVAMAAEEEGRELLDRMESGEFPSPTERQIKRIQHDIKKQNKQSLKNGERSGASGLRRLAIAACFFALIMALFCGSVLCFPQLRNYVGSFLVSKHNGIAHICLQITDQDGNPVTTAPSIGAVDKYMPEYLPKGTELNSIFAEENLFKVMYTNSSVDGYLCLSGYTANSITGYNANDSVVVDSVKINGSSGYLLRGVKAYGVLWTYNGICLVIMTNMGYDEAIRVAESIR